jgi:hypothetical protein
MSTNPTPSSSLHLERRATPIFLEWDVMEGPVQIAIVRRGIGGALQVVSGAVPDLVELGAMIARGADRSDGRRGGLD